MTTTRKNTGTNASNANDAANPATAPQGNGNSGGNTGASPATGGGRGPTHVAYQVREGREKGKSYWTRIGAAWPHSDGEGFNIQLECVPLDGRVTLRVASEAKE